MDRLAEGPGHLGDKPEYLRDIRRRDEVPCQKDAWQSGAAVSGAQVIDGMSQPEGIDSGGEPWKVAVVAQHRVFQAGLLRLEQEDIVSSRVPVLVMGDEDPATRRGR